MESPALVLILGLPLTVVQLKVRGLSLLIYKGRIGAGDFFSKVLPYFYSCSRVTLRKSGSWRKS